MTKHVLTYEVGEKKYTIQYDDEFDTVDFDEKILKKMYYGICRKLFDNIKEVVTND